VAHSRLNRREVEFFRCRSVAQATDRFTRDPNRVHGSQPVARVFYRAHDFVHVSRFKTLDDGRKVKLIHKELPEDGAFITAQIGPNEVCIRSS